MSNIELYNPTSGLLAGRQTKALARGLASVHYSSALQVARIEAAVQCREAVADGITAVTAKAMQHVAVVSQAEQNMAQTVPHASGRLAAVADAHALAMTAIVMDTAHALGRLA